MSNPFKAVVKQLNDGSTQSETGTSLSTEEKKKLFEQTKKYIFIQDLMKEVQPCLEANETIHAYLPLTSDGDNFGASSVGLLGMYAVKTERGKQYVKEFNDIRGNRLMIFTDHRMIFMTIIEFIEEQLFYTYPYESIKKITFKRNKINYLEWNGLAIPRKKELNSYIFDFQSGDHLFTDMLGEREAQILRKQLLEIPQLQEVVVSEKIYREKRIDRLLNNPILNYKIFYYFFISVAGIFLLSLIVGGLFHFGAGKLLFDWINELLKV